LTKLIRSARKDENPSITRDVSGEGVQQALLKIWKARRQRFHRKAGASIPTRNSTPVDTTNILFICGGAFG